MIYNVNRRKFIELFSYSCCGLILPSCSKVPITNRRQLTIYPEATINNQAYADKKIYFVNNQAYADLKIYFVTNQAYAGWKNSSKKSLMY